MSVFCCAHRDPIPTCSECNPPRPLAPAVRHSLTQYVVLHRSAAKHPGVLAAQAIHAAGESIRTAPVPSSTYAVALVADTSADLEQLSEVLKANGIHHVLIREPDPPYNGAATALGVEPMERDLVRPFMSHLKVLR